MEVVEKERYITNNSEIKKRVIYFDILNILACISVIFIHVNNNIVYNYSKMRVWKESLIIIVLSCWAVPVFLMLSGATLLNYRDRYNTKEFFKKRFTKILIPWIIWSLIIFIINNENINTMQFVKDFFYCNIEKAYWFLPLILYLYCHIPIFSICIEKEEYKKILKGIAFVIFIFTSINTVCTMFDIDVPTIFTYFSTNSIYIIYLILGYFLSTENVSNKNKTIIYILGFLSMLILFLYINIMSTLNGKLNIDLYNYTTPFIIIIAVSVFLFVKSINWEKIINKLHIKLEFISKISSCSFGIYLIHMLIINKLTYFLKLNIYSFLYRTIYAIAIYLICLVIVFIIKKIPMLRKIVP